MLIFEYITLAQIIIGVAVTALVLAILLRIGALRNWFDPMLLPLFQTTLTVVLLGGRVIPLADVFMYLIFLFLISWGRDRPKIINSSSILRWQRIVVPLFVLSVILNAYVISEKGFLLFEDDVGVARQEFYQGWGLVQRLNSVCAVIFGIRWAIGFTSGQAKNNFILILLLWTSYLILSLGSKSGLYTLLTCIGCIGSFQGIRLNLRNIIIICFGVVTSIAVMFFIFFGAEAWTYFGVRFISFTDGPFYYFRSPTAPVVSLSYSFDQLLVALRFYDALPQSSLGPAINWDYFSFDNELVGPNPQIFVEARAILGVMWPMYYVIVAGAITVILRCAKTPFDLALLAMVAMPLAIDSQFAMSNVMNVALAYLLKIMISVMPKFRTNYDYN